MTKPEYITIRQASVMLDISVTRIWQLVNAKKLRVKEKRSTTGWPLNPTQVRLADVTKRKALMEASR